MFTDVIQHDKVIDYFFERYREDYEWVYDPAASQRRALRWDATTDSFDRIVITLRKKSKIVIPKWMNKQHVWRKRCSPT